MGIFKKIADKRAKSKVQEFSLDELPNISESDGSERLYTAGVAHRQNQLYKVAKHIDWRPKMRESSEHFMPVILRQEENMQASGGEAVAIYFYNIHIGYVSEDDLRSVKKRISSLTDAKEVRADAKLCCNPIEKLTDASNRWYVTYEA
ncbi:hypothetical protein [Arcanobacterium haemolyticum]